LPNSYPDRRAAGQILARQLVRFANRPDVCVLALPRGGVPVGFEVAQALNVPLDVFVVRKLGVPGHEELAMGAIASGGALVLNTEVVQHLGIPESAINAAVEREAAELSRRETLYRDKPLVDLENKTVIVVDDGLATGSTMRAAIAAVRHHKAGRIIVAVPVAAPDSVDSLGNEVDEIICPLTPRAFQAVGQWYLRFDQTTDEEVRDLLARANTSQSGRALGQ
jgi:predicted phosphoribosyltransferase